MQTSLCLLASAALIVGSAAAQKKSLLPRAEVQVSGGNGTDEGASWHIAAPDDKSAPAGLLPTANLLYACWVEPGKKIGFTRSTDGGLTWEKSRAIFTYPSTANIETEEIEILPTGAFVFVAFLGRGIGANTNDDCWVIGSADQGKTWTPKPTLLSPANARGGRGGPNDCDDLSADVSLGIAHMVWETHLTSPEEDCYYSSVTMQGGAIKIVTPETRLNTNAAAGTRDVDQVYVAADGPFVLVAWRAAVGQGDGNNGVFSKFSNQFGRNLGTLPVTKYLGAMFGIDDTPVAVAGPNGYIVVNAGSPDVLTLFFTNNIGKTWMRTKSIGHAAGDVDGPHIAAQGNTVAVSWETDQDANRPTNMNDIYIAVDPTKGAKFKAGTFKRIRLNDTSQKWAGTPLMGGRSRHNMRDDNHVNLLMRDSYIAAVWRESSNNTTAQTKPEDVTIAESHDGGATFRTMRMVTKLAPTSSNRPEIAMTANHDLGVVWADTRGATNEVFVTGTKYPELINNTAMKKGLKIDIVEKKRAGEFGLVLLSATGTTPPIVLDNVGFKINLAFDAVTVVGLNFPFIFLGVVNSSGVVSLPLAPDLGKKFYAAAIGIDFQNSRFTWFSDPIRY